MTSATTKGSNSARSTTSEGDAASRERTAKYVKDMPTKIEAMKTQCNSRLLGPADLGPAAQGVGRSLRL